MDKLLIAFILLLNIIVFSHSSTNPTENVIKNILKGIDTATISPEMTMVLKQLEGLSEVYKQPLIMGNNHEYAKMKSIVFERIQKNTNMINYLVTENEKNLLPFVSQDFDKITKPKKDVAYKVQWNGEDFVAQNLVKLAKQYPDRKLLKDNSETISREENNIKMTNKISHESATQWNGEDFLKKTIGELEKLFKDRYRKSNLGRISEEKAAEELAKLHQLEMEIKRLLLLEQIKNAKEAINKD
uniref:Uncharacterized protein n=1 Tax=Strongyloides venezuelensis TaxID=75913 RepID=A0A0K0EWN1_STRVS